ncbi:MAG: hypothetical protein EZS28_008605 [Streblomastix strix]|uniref:Uncharacterized protein n=1 Tax=Streblomastix strix TaxID=222440 RepID=A0A5J4WNT9_9EUKA|nr:MAG: hypothetical protein EZS28_008605 [Streblomastix strix]
MFSFRIIVYQCLIIFFLKPVLYIAKIPSGAPFPWQGTAKFTPKSVPGINISSSLSQAQIKYLFRKCGPSSDRQCTYSASLINSLSNIVYTASKVKLQL